MIKPIWAAVAGIAVLGTAGVAGAVIVGSSDSEEEVAQQTTRASASAAPSPTQSVSPVATETPAPTATPSIPEDWPTYADPGGLFTIRYPSTWLEIDGTFFSSDPRTSGGYSQPPDMVQVEISYREAAGSDTCGGTISTDLKSGEEIGPLPGTTATTLGGAPAWELMRVQGDPAIEGDLTRIHRIAVVHGGYCLYITAYYTQQNPDVATFLDIASSFEFRPQTG